MLILTLLPPHQYLSCLIREVWVRNFGLVDRFGNTFYININVWNIFTYDNHSASSEMTKRENSSCLSIWILVKMHINCHNFGLHIPIRSWNMPNLSSTAKATGKIGTSQKNRLSTTWLSARKLKFVLYVDVYPVTEYKLVCDWSEFRHVILLYKISANKNASLKMLRCVHNHHGGPQRTRCLCVCVL